MILKNLHIHFVCKFLIRYETCLCILDSTRMAVGGGSWKIRSGHRVVPLSMTSQSMGGTLLPRQVTSRIIASPHFPFSSRLRCLETNLLPILAVTLIGKPRTLSGPSKSWGPDWSLISCDRVRRQGERAGRSRWRETCHKIWAKFGYLAGLKSADGGQCPGV